MEGEITRQHDDTSMTEIVGECCQDFIVVYDEDDEICEIFYLKLSHISHRFYNDAGLLFWRSGENPDEDDDLYGGNCSYTDLGKKYDIVGSLIESISYQNDHLEMKFSNGVRLLFESGVDDVGSRLIEVSSGGD